VRSDLVVFGGVAVAVDSVISIIESHRLMSRDDTPGEAATRCHTPLQHTATYCQPDLRFCCMKHRIEQTYDSGLHSRRLHFRVHSR